MDDCTIAVPASLANRIAADLADIYAASGLILILQNCRFIGPEAAHIEYPVFACNPEGNAVLGSLADPTVHNVASNCLRFTLMKDFGRKVT
jgi:hypothetical protein